MSITNEQIDDPTPEPRRCPCGQELQPQKPWVELCEACLAYDMAILEYETRWGARAWELQGNTPPRSKR